MDVESAFCLTNPKTPAMRMKLEAVRLIKIKRLRDRNMSIEGIWQRLTRPEIFFFSPVKESEGEREITSELRLIMNTSP
jgi:hypothetical protein